MDASRSGIMSDLRKAAAAATARPWAFLSPDLLADVCSRLHDAVDFVRFHAVCTPWRHAVPSMHSLATPPHAFLPWLVTQCNGRIVHSPVIYFGRRASEPKPNDRRRDYTGIVLAERGASSDGNWVGSADGRSAYLLTGGSEPTLFDLVTGAVTRLPPFRIEDDDEIEWTMTNPRGTVYGDGTVFLYSFDFDWFKAAILRPGDTAWTLVETRLILPLDSHHSRAAYHGGKVLVWVGAYWWCLVRPDFGANGHRTTTGILKTTWDRLEDEYYTRDHNHVFESRGELLWASILVERRQKPDDDHARYNNSTAPTLAVRVHALEEEEDEEGGGNKMRWAERDDRTLGDRVMFLGSPASFAADAAKLGVDGGCAYFVFNRQVFRYSFVDDQAKPVEWVCPGWRGSNMARMWLRPQQPGFATPSKKGEEQSM